MIEAAYTSYSRQGEWTDLGGVGTTLHSDASLAELAKYVQSLLVHSDYLPAYDLSPGDFPGEDRSTRKVAERLKAFRESGGRRQLGSCRDYALLLCGLLREGGRAARLRCGFADYLIPGRWEDHWVCEYQADGEENWRLADAQLDAVLREKLTIDFDILDLPRARFLSGLEAWRAWREGKANPSLFSHGREAAGECFLLLNLVRDRLALAGREVTDWDRWREDLPWRDGLSGKEKALGDAIAEGETLPPQPFWLS